MAAGDRLMRALTRLGMAAALVAGLSAPAMAFQPTAHQAFYTMSLDRARSTSGVVGASGSLVYKWADVCTGWTIEQHYNLNLQYDTNPPVEINSDFVTWEGKDGKTYRFHERETRNGDVDADIAGDAAIKDPKHTGIARFERPKPRTFILPAGTLFPTAHTLTLIHQGEAGQHYFAAHVFDGSTVDGSSTISAVLNPILVSPVAVKNTGVKSPLLDRPAWSAWLGFYSDATQDIQPDYTLGMRLLDNGVSSDMILDYGDYVVKATLRTIEALPKPGC